MLFTRTVITPTSTTLGLPDGTTRDLTTQSSVYIYETGTYTANVQTSDTFAYLSNVDEQDLGTIYKVDISAMGTTIIQYGVPGNVEQDTCRRFSINTSQT